MKNYLSIVILLFLGLSLNAQAPQGFNYQATVRDVWAVDYKVQCIFQV